MSPTDRDDAPAGGQRGARIRIDQGQRLEIMRRIDAGESQSALAREFGCSRQYISQLRARFKQFGAWGIEPRPRGRPKSRPLEESLQQAIRSAIETSQPSEHNLPAHHDLGDAWHIDAVRELVKRENGWTPTRGQIIELFERWNLSRDYFRTWKLPVPEDSETTDPDFEEWSRSPVARRIRQREAELRAQAEAEAKAGPSKAAKATHSSTAAPDDSDADFQAFLRNFEESRHQHTSPSRQRQDATRIPSSGLRTGKHSKAKRPARKKRKRKSIRRRRR